MTTGRINQVTILTGIPGIAATKSRELPVKEARSAPRLGRARRRNARPEHSERRVTACEPLTIQLPPLKFSRNGPPQNDAGPVRATCHLRHIFLQRGISSTCHAPRDGYRLRSSPKFVSSSAGDQPIIHRLPRSPQSWCLRDFDHCSVIKAGGVLENNQAMMTAEC